MKRYVQFAKKAATKSAASIKNDGLVAFTKRAGKYAYYRQFPHLKPQEAKDILFINGSALPHPARYRVQHQMEQLLSRGISSESVFYEQLTMDMLRRYRGFVFFRTPVTPTIKAFIEEARRHNKACFYDIDDLVIDTKYTNQNKYVREMSEQDKALYDNGVVRMHETLSMIDLAITTTESLATELKQYTKEVYINRNVASDEMVRRSLEALDKVSRDPHKVVAGYFSGSITHNEDFELIIPALVDAFKHYDNFYLKVVGYLDLPDALKPYENRVIRTEFMDWRGLPADIASCDINLAPLTENIFNEAKSENKWTEAALVKVPTLASDFGAFKVAVQDGETGVLVGAEDWFKQLSALIEDAPLRQTIGERAYAEVIAHRTTLSTARGLADFIESKLARNIGFVLPSTDISGGVNVIIKHAEILKKRGWDVTLIDAIDKRAYHKSVKKYEYRKDIEGHVVLPAFMTKFDTYFDTLTATLWSTLKFVKKYSEVKHRLYFVQSYETDFLGFGGGEPRFKANATYTDRTGVRYVTMSLWCKRWLEEQFGKKARYASNGIDGHFYPFVERKFSKDKKVKILIEGDSRSEKKNTDEAFRIVEQLDPSKYEVSYLSYRREPKPWYRVDKYYNRIPPEEVGKVYAENDILIKTSILESFSYPPLEMMATGGLVVVLPNDGNIEYLKDGENSLFYTHGNIQHGVETVEKLVADKKLRDKLIVNGRKTAEAYEWSRLEESVAALYE